MARCLVAALSPLRPRRDRPTATLRAFAAGFTGDTVLENGRSGLAIAVGGDDADAVSVDGVGFRLSAGCLPSLGSNVLGVTTVAANARVFAASPARAPAARSG